MYLTGTSLRKVWEIGSCQVHSLRKKAGVSIFFDHRLAKANDKYYQLIRVTTANLIIRYYKVLW